MFSGNYSSTLHKYISLKISKFKKKTLVIIYCRQSLYLLCSLYPQELRCLGHLPKFHSDHSILQFKNVHGQWTRNLKIWKHFPAGGSYEKQLHITLNTGYIIDWGPNCWALISIAAFTLKQSLPRAVPSQWLSSVLILWQTYS